MVNHCAVPLMRIFVLLQHFHSCFLVFSYHLTTITTGPGFLWDFVLLLLKTCSLYHEKLFIQDVNDISSQVFNNFFSASDIMEAVRGHLCFYRYECNARLRDTSWIKRKRVAFSILICRAVGRGKNMVGLRTDTSSS